MNDSFHKLETEKQERIINASLKEFAAKGFNDASTNIIVKEAKISKGSLFNYFDGKKDLYLYVAEYSSQIIEKIYEAVDFSERDLFIRLEEIGIAKLKLQQRFPQVFDFLVSMVNEESAEVEEGNKDKINWIYKDGLEKIYENIDYSKFKEDIDVKKAIDILTWTMFGYGNRAIEELDSIEEVEESYLREWKQYSEILKKAFYKTNCQN